MLDKLDAEFAFGREALDLRANRQMLLSSNIANANTPGYRARDVDFASSLAVKLKRATITPLASTSSTVTPGHMNIASTALAHDKLLYRVPVQPALDGNTVDLDLERVQFANNTLHYETGLTVLTQQIKTMLAAITSGG